MSSRNSPHLIDITSICRFLQLCLLQDDLDFKCNETTKVRANQRIKLDRSAMNQKSIIKILWQFSKETHTSQRKVSANLYRLLKLHKSKNIIASIFYLQKIKNYMKKKRNFHSFQKSS